MSAGEPDPTDVIIDTNVLKVANGDHDQASAECVLRCAERLKRTISGGAVAVDNSWVILGQYENNLPAGAPREGYMFLRQLLREWKSGRIVQVIVHPNEDRGYDEFPEDPRLARFDPSDRVFVAVALAHPHGPKILNAVDPDWDEHRVALEDNGLSIEQICG